MLKGVHEVSERSLEVSLVALCSHAVHLNTVSMGLQTTDLKFIFMFLLPVCRHQMLLLRLSSKRYYSL